MAYGRFSRRSYRRRPGYGRRRKFRYGSRKTFTAPTRYPRALGFDWSPGQPERSRVVTLRRFAAGTELVNNSTTTGTGATLYAITVGLRWPASADYPAYQLLAGNANMCFPDLTSLSTVWKKYKIHWVKLHLFYIPYPTYASALTTPAGVSYGSMTPMWINSVPWNDSEDPNQVALVLNQRQGSRTTVLDSEHPFTTFKIYPKCYDEISSGSALIGDEPKWVKFPWVSFKDELATAGLLAGDTCGYGLVLKWPTIPPYTCLRIVPEFKVSFTDLV